MTNLLPYFLLLPGVGYVASLLAPRRSEKTVSGIAFATVGGQLLLALAFTVFWLVNGAPAIDQKEVVLYQTPHYSFFIDLSFDKVTAVYLLVGSILTFLVTVYSRIYLHREEGYKRFYNLLQFFFLGYVLTIFAGNLETLFVGWEVLGLTSFLLIAFYRTRYLPVKNAVKVFSVYRIGDVGLILAMWLAHHVWHHNIRFSELAGPLFQTLPEGVHPGALPFIGFAILVAAAAKSAQLPFSSWLPRAMEGPTPSSAIFYGSLSVHIGVFLLLRTYPLWHEETSVRVAIAVIGLLSAFLASGIGRVQSSIKSQVAYASLAQIGLIFVEVALGWHTLALVHFAGNAFLRTYQLLVSPSVVSYLIREQFYEFEPAKSTVESWLPKKLQYTLYMLSVKEWNLDNMLYRFLWNPLKWAGRKLDFLSVNRALVLFTPVYLLGMVGLFNENLMPGNLVAILPILFSIVGLVLVLKAFTERHRAIMSWVFVLLNHLCVALAIAFNEHVGTGEITLYLSGIFGAAAIGFLCLRRLRNFEGGINLDRFHGHGYEHPKIAAVFLLACLGMAGFPITPTFIGEDLVFTHIHEDQPALALFTALSLIIDGIAIIRIYARLFMGPHVKSVYDMGYRSS